MLNRLASLSLNRPRLTVAVWGVLGLIFVILTTSSLATASLWDRLSRQQNPPTGSESLAGQEILESDADGYYRVTLLVEGIDIEAHHDEVVKAITKSAADLERIPGVLPSVVHPYTAGSDPNNETAKALMDSFIGTDKKSFLMVVTVALNQYPDRREQLLNKVETAMNSIPREFKAFAPGVSAVVSDKALIDADLSAQSGIDFWRSWIIAIFFVSILLLARYRNLIRAGIHAASFVMALSISLIFYYLTAAIWNTTPGVVAAGQVLATAFATAGSMVMSHEFFRQLHLSDSKPVRSARSERVKSRRQRRQKFEDKHINALESAAESMQRLLGVSGLLTFLIAVATSIFNVEGLRSFGVASAGTVLVIMVLNFTFTPALLLWAAKPLEQGKTSFTVPRWIRAIKAFFVNLGRAIARSVKKLTRGKYLLIAGIVNTVLVVVLSIPAFGMQTRFSQPVTLPTATEQGHFLSVLKTKFPHSEREPDARVLTKTSQTELDHWVHDKLAALTGTVIYFDPGIYDDHHAINLTFADPLPSSAENLEKVKFIRAQKASFPFYVTGPSAAELDFDSALFWGVPIMALGLILLVLITVFMVTNTLSITFLTLMFSIGAVIPTLGLDAWLFQDGNLGWLLGYSAQGAVDGNLTMLLWLFGILCGIGFQIILLYPLAFDYYRHHDHFRALDECLQKTREMHRIWSLVTIGLGASLMFSSLIGIKMLGVSLLSLTFWHASVRRLLWPTILRGVGSTIWWTPAWLTGLREKIARQFSPHEAKEAKAEA